MAQVLTSSLLPPLSFCRRRTTPRPLLLRNPNPGSGWAALQADLACKPRFSCFFSNGRKQEQARKALEGALGGKKSELEKWDKEIKKREERGGSGSNGGGGWFGGGGWSNWFNNEHFWEEAQQAILAILGIVFLYLLLAKGNVMFALVFNSLLFVLRGSRNFLTFVSSSLPFKTTSVATGDQSVNDTFHHQKSAKDSVATKWGSN